MQPGTAPASVLTRLANTAWSFSQLWIQLGLGLFQGNSVAQPADGSQRVVLLVGVADETVRDPGRQQFHRAQLVVYALPHPVADLLDD